MINNSEHLTKKCSCDNKQWIIDRKEIVKSGKDYGKKKYSCQCLSCKARWKTFSTNGIEHLL